jgi:hypothetical protein
MTKKEKALLAEIHTLETKLEHAQKWMSRQVEESSSANHHFFERLEKRHSLGEKIGLLIEKIHRFHPFRHRPTLSELWGKRFEAFLMGAAIILFWRGIWNLADNYLFHGHPIESAFASLFIGMGLMIMMKGFVNQFLDEAVEEAD